MAATNNYTFDASKLGVLTGAVWSGGLTNRWQATTLNTLGQVTQESWNGSGLTLRASGLAGNATAVSAALDGGNVGNLVYDSGRWYADLGLNTGTHTLAATATYPVPPLTNTATSAFTVVGTNNVTDYYDGAGNVISRVFANGKTQTLTWDGSGRLASMTQRDAATNGFNWTAVYDGLGRRLRTIHTPVGTNVVYAAQALVTDSYYDPQVEFGELAVALNGQRTWKVVGLDANGRYGSKMGLGGVEATVRESDGQLVSMINDYFGNVLATVSGTNANWNPVRVGGYGPANGYQAATLSLSTPLSETLVWRSRRIDPSGFYYLGARYYDPLASRFLSPDPLGHASDLSLYSFCSSDPVNHFDADGRQDSAISPQEAVQLANDPEFRAGFYQGTWVATKVAIAAGVAYITGGAAAPYLAPYASTTFTVIGTGLISGAAGDATVQGIELVTGERQRFSTTQTAVSSLLGGVLNYGVNRVLSPRITTGQIGNAEIGEMGEERAAQELFESGNNPRAQIQFRTADGKPKSDFLIDDATTPSGYRGIEVKTGNADLTYPQEWGYPHVEAGESSFMGKAATEAGLPVGQPLLPTPVDLWRYYGYEFLPFGPAAGGALSSSAITLGGGAGETGGTYIQQDSTGKHVKPR